MKPMNLDINNLPELISKQKFHLILEDVLNRQNNLSSDIVIQYLIILGERFEKFYDINELTIKEKKDIYAVLKVYTDFNRLDIVEDLINIMFQFRIDKYIDYLKRNLKSVKRKEVYDEIYDAISEYNL
jgi:hypothetical protein